MSKTLRLMTLVASAALFSASFSAGALAATPWQNHHPRRAEVNARLANQTHRIHNEVREGDITHAQAASLHRRDRQIRGEERAMASQQGGHLTYTQKRALNQQENHVSREIGR